jgi:hypothetical protein
VPKASAAVADFLFFCDDERDYKLFPHSLCVAERFYTRCASTHTCERPVATAQDAKTSSVVNSHDAFLLLFSIFRQEHISLLFV